MNLAAGYPESGVTVRQAIFTVEPLAFEGSISSTHLIYLKSWSALSAWLPTAGFVACSVWFANSSLDDAMHVQSICIYIYISAEPGCARGSAKGKKSWLRHCYLHQKVSVLHWHGDLPLGVGFRSRSDARHSAVLGTVRQRISEQDPKAKRANKNSKQEQHFVLTRFRTYVLHFVLQYQILYR